MQATTYILLKHGHAGLSTNSVAKRAGVNIATLYQYFPNKESLIAELSRRHVEETRAAALAVLGGPARGRGLEATVRLMVDALLASHRVHPALHRILTQQAMREGHARLETASDTPLYQLARGWLEAAPTRFDDPDLTLWMAATAAHALLHAALLERPHVIDQPLFAEELTRLVARYLRA